MPAQAYLSVDGSPRTTVDSVTITRPEPRRVYSETAVCPDPNWEMTDRNEHIHRFSGTSLPTLQPLTARVSCDGSCGGCDEWMDVTLYACRECGDWVTPSWIPNEIARTSGIPIFTKAPRATITVSEVPEGLDVDSPSVQRAKVSVVSERANFSVYPGVICGAEEFMKHDGSPYYLEITMELETHP